MARLELSEEMTKILMIAEMSYRQFQNDFEASCEAAGVEPSQAALIDYFDHLKLFYESELEK